MPEEAKQNQETTARPHDLYMCRNLFQTLQSLTFTVAAANRRSQAEHRTAPRAPGARSMAKRRRTPRSAHAAECLATRSRSRSRKRLFGRHPGGLGCLSIWLFIEQKWLNPVAVHED